MKNQYYKNGLPKVYRRIFKTKSHEIMTSLGSNRDNRYYLFTSPCSIYKKSRLTRNSNTKIRVVGLLCFGRNKQRSIIKQNINGWAENTVLLRFHKYDFVNYC